MPSSNVMTTTQVDHPVNLYYQKKVLTRVIPKLIHAQFGQNVSMPQHEGDTTKWRRWSNMLAQTVPLTEGEDPTPILASKTDLTASIKEYGASMKISSWMKFTGITPDADNIVNVMLDGMALTADTLTRDVLAGTGSSTTASNGTPTDEFINKTDIDTIVTNLEGENAMMVTPMLGAGSGQGTSPIRPGYIGIAHTAQRPLLEKVAGFKHFTNYSNPTDRYDGEFCSTNDVRWLLTTNAYISGYYYYCLIMAKEFFGNVKIDGNSAGKPLIFTPPDRTGSPLQRFSYIAWVLNYACRVLNDNFGHILKTYITSH